MPAFVVAYAGDALYAVMIWHLFALLWPGARWTRLSLGAFAACALVEASQALHPAWLDAARSHRAVALVLGRGFLWSDLVCYAVGAGVAGYAWRERG